MSLGRFAGSSGTRNSRNGSKLISGITALSVNHFMLPSSGSGAVARFRILSMRLKSSPEMSKPVKSELLHEGPLTPTAASTSMPQNRTKFVGRTTPGYWGSATSMSPNSIPNLPRRLTKPEIPNSMRAVARSMLPLKSSVEDCPPTLFASGATVKSAVTVLGFPLSVPPARFMLSERLATDAVTTSTPTSAAWPTVALRALHVRLSVPL